MTEPAEQPDLRIAPRTWQWTLLDRQQWLERLVKCGAFAELSQSARAVLIVLFTHANESREAWPSLRTIQTESGYRQTAVRGALKWLVGRKLIERDAAGTGRRSTTYRLVALSGWESPDAPNGTSHEDIHVSPGRHPGPRVGATQGGAGLRHLTRPMEPAHRTAEPGAPSASGGGGRLRLSMRTRAAERMTQNAPGLFAAHELLADLIAATFERRDARRLIDRHGVGAVRHALDFTQWRVDRGDSVMSFRRHLVAVLKGTVPVDDQFTADAAPDHPQSQNASPAEREPHGASAHDASAHDAPTLDDAHRWLDGMSDADRDVIRNRALAGAPALTRRLSEVHPDNVFVRSRMAEIVAADATLFPDLVMSHD